MTVFGGELVPGDGLAVYVGDLPSMELDVVLREVRDLFDNYKGRTCSCNSHGSEFCNEPVTHVIEWSERIGDAPPDFYLSTSCEPCTLHGRANGEISAVRALPRELLTPAQLADLEKRRAMALR